MGQRRDAGRDPALPRLAKRSLAATLCAAAALAGCSDLLRSGTGHDARAMVGAWRSRIHATSGALAGLDNLQFMYAFNAGGTMTESSNYDSSPPAPPAYGVWRWTAPQTFEVRYAFFTSRPPAAFEAIAKGGGWAPDGYGVMTEEISLADDGQSFDSSLAYRLFDAGGKPTPGGGQAHGSGVRIGF